MARVASSARQGWCRQRSSTSTHCVRTEPWAARDSRCRATLDFRDGGPANDRLDVQKVWLLIAFEMWKERWDSGSEQGHSHPGSSDLAMTGT